MHALLAPQLIVDSSAIASLRQLSLQSATVSSVCRMMTAVSADMQYCPVLLIHSGTTHPEAKLISC